MAISGGGSFGSLAYKPDANSTHACLAAARDAGAHQFLTKPFDLSDLRAACVGRCELKEPGRALPVRGWGQP